MVVICLHLDELLFVRKVSELQVKSEDGRSTRFGRKKAGTEVFLKDKNKDLNEYEDSEKITPCY
jgi:hypothetical protein